MSPEVTGGDIPNQNFEIADLPEFSAVVAFDGGKAALYEACKEFAGTPNVDNVQGLIELSNNLVETFRESIQVIAETESSSESIMAVASLMAGDDLERNTLFNELTGTGLFKPWSKRPVVTLRKKFQTMAKDAEDMDELLDMISGSYTNALGQELNQFVSLMLQHSANTDDELDPSDDMEESSYQEPRVIKQELAQLIGRNLGDVAKLAGGIIIAGWVLGRKRS